MLLKGSALESYEPPLFYEFQRFFDLLRGVGVVGWGFLACLASHDDDDDILLRGRGFMVFRAPADLGRG